MGQTKHRQTHLLDQTRPSLLNGGVALVRRGEIKADGIFEDLALIEGLRTTGRLKFRSGDIKGAVALVNGQLAAEQPSEEHLESLLALKEGEYQLHQELPPLPVSQGDSEERQGSLEVHVAADVMNYCERAGLTGSLRYQQDSASADIRYDAGEMNTIRLCGLEDLHEVFGWEKGTFVVRVEASISEASKPESASDSGGSGSIEPKPSVDSEAPTEKKPSLGDGSDAKVAVSIETPRKPAREDEATIEMALPPIFPTSDLPPMRHRDTLEDTGQQLLRIVEMSLAEIESEREERRPATRTSPPLPPLNPRDTPLPRKRRDQTVRILVVADPEDDIPTQKRQAVDARAAAKALKAPALKTQTTATAPPRTDPNAGQGDASARAKPTTPEAPPVQRAAPALPNIPASDPKEATKQPSLARPRAGSIQENPPRSKWPVVFLVALALLALGAAFAMR